MVAANRSRSHLRALPHPGLDHHPPSSPDDDTDRHQRLARHFKVSTITPNASLNPLDPSSGYSDPFNPIAELITAHREYTSDETTGAWLTVRAFPRQLVEQMGRLQAQSKRDNHRVGQASAAAVCVFFGTALLSRDPSVDRLDALRDALDNCNDLSDEAEEAYSIWQTALIGTDSTQRGVTRLNVRIPQDIKDGLQELSRKVGSSESFIAPVAIAAALSATYSTTDRATRSCSSLAAIFARKVRFRARLAELIIAEFVPQLKSLITTP